MFEMSKVSNVSKVFIVSKVSKVSKVYRVSHRDSAKGGFVPPIVGGQMRGDEAYMGEIGAYISGQFWGTYFFKNSNSLEAFKAKYCVKYSMWHLTKFTDGVGDRYWKLGQSFDGIGDRE